MFTIVIIIFIAVSFLILVIHGCRKLCEDPGPPLSYGDTRSPASPPLAPMPGLPSLPSGAIPVGLEPPPYNEVTAKPNLYPLPPGLCPECGRGAQPHFATQTSF